MRISVIRKAHFNAAHRLNVPDWTPEKNREIFGVCNNPHYHGHNYDLEVKLTGETDPVTGFLIDLNVLKDVIEREIISYLDHRNLNEEIPEFRQMNSTVENICYVIWQRLRKVLDEQYEIKVKLYETVNNAAVYPA